MRNVTKRALPFRPFLSKVGLVAADADELSIRQFAPHDLPGSKEILMSFSKADCSNANKTYFCRDCWPFREDRYVGAHRIYEHFVCWDSIRYHRFFAKSGLNEDKISPL